MVHLEDVCNEFYVALSEQKNFERALSHVANVVYRAGIADMSANASRWLHKKTGHVYLLMNQATDCTNARNESSVAVYCREGCPEKVYTRDWEEFILKFEEMK